MVSLSFWLRFGVTQEGEVGKDECGLLPLCPFLCVGLLQDKWAASNI